MRGGNMSRYPWRDTSEDIAKQSGSQWETPAGAQEKADKALADAKEYTDEQNQNFNDHIENTVIHVTQSDKDYWNNHIQDNVRHVTSAEHAKLTNIQEGAEVNQNAFSIIKSPGRNDVTAKLKQDSLNLAGGTGIAITTNEVTNTVTFSATGEALPGPHGGSHNIIDGSDPIPDLVQLREDFDNLTPSEIGAETPEGAQSKADAVGQAIQGNLTTHASTQVFEDEAHGLRVTDGALEWFNGTEWVAVQSGGSAQLAAESYYVNAATGDNNNDGLTVGTPFKTIQKAVDTISKLDHPLTISINLAAGTYDESVIISLMGVGRLNIKGAPNASLSPSYKIRSIAVQYCEKRVNIEGVELTATSSHAIQVIQSKWVGLFQSVMTVSATGVYGVTTENSNMWVSGCAIANRYAAIFSNMCSTVHSSGNTGGGNTFGLQARASSTIGKEGTQPSGATAESAAGGSVIR